MLDYLTQQSKQGLGPYTDFLKWCIKRYEKIETQSTTLDIKDIQFKKKACYVNAANVVLHYPEVNYVLGYVASVIPIEHAWCEHHGVHFDPTASLFEDDHFKEYGRVITLNEEQLTQWLEENQCVPPNLEGIWRSND